MTAREIKCSNSAFSTTDFHHEFVGLSYSSEDYTLSSLPADKSDFTSINITNI